MRAAGVVDEEVDPAERLGGARDEVAYLLGIGDVGPLRVDDGAVRAQLLGRRQHLVLVPCADRHAHALAHELAGDRGADPLRAAGDERAASFETELHL